jgi:hypothetical protein
MPFSVNQFLQAANRSLEHERIEIDVRGNQLSARGESLAAQVKRFFTRHVRLLDRNEAVSRAFFNALETEFGKDVALKAMGVVRPDVRRLTPSDTFSVSRPYLLTAGQIKVAVAIARSLSSQAEVQIESTNAGPDDLASLTQSQEAADANRSDVHTELQSALSHASAIAEHHPEETRQKSFEAIQAALDGLAHACQSAAGLLYSSLEHDQEIQLLHEQVTAARDQLLARYLSQAFGFSPSHSAATLSRLISKFENDQTAVPFSVEVDEAVALDALSVDGQQESADTPETVLPVIRGLKSLYEQLKTSQTDGSDPPIEPIARQLRELKENADQLISYMVPNRDSELESDKDLSRDNEYALEFSNALKGLTSELGSTDTDNLHQHLPKLRAYIVTAYINAHRFDPSEIRQARLATQFETRVKDRLKDQPKNIAAHKLSALLERRPQPEAYLHAAHHYLKLSDMLPVALTPAHQEAHLKALSKVKVTMSDAIMLITSREDRGLGTQADFQRYWSDVDPLNRINLDNVDTIDREFDQELFDDRVDLILAQEGEALERFRESHPGEVPDKFAGKLSTAIDSLASTRIHAQVYASPALQVIKPSDWLIKAKTYLDEAETYADYAKAHLGYRNPKDFTLADHFSAGFLEAFGQDLVALKACAIDIAMRSDREDRDSLGELTKRIDLMLNDPVIDFDSMWHRHLGDRGKAASATPASN